MDASSIVAIVAAGISALAAVTSAWLAGHTVQAERLAVADQLASRYREPLLQAAFNLQSRVYNIVKLRFLDRFSTDSNSDDEREYAVENTLYLLGQYFCWVEVVRRESQFLDPRSRVRNGEVAERLERVRDVFSASDQPETVFRLFRGEQRAIGEVMLQPTSAASAGLPRWECLGYAAFVDQVQKDSISRWFRKTRADLELLHSESGRTQRLIEIQHALLVLIRTLDPHAERVSHAMVNPL